MSIVTNKLEVVMDDGTEYTVLADQRDFAGWEAADTEGSSHTMIRWWAWNSMSRSGQYSKPFASFNVKDCVQVGMVPEKNPEASEGDEGLDPTKTSPSSTPGRKSRSGGS